MEWPQALDWHSVRLWPDWAAQIDAHSWAQVLLKVEGYHVTAVGSLREALQKARELDGIDLLITDYHLQDGETGTQVIVALREELQGVLKAVLITGDALSDIRELPRDPYLRIASKPVKAGELLTMVATLLAA